jgi:hypothetical protein
MTLKSQKSRFGFLSHGASRTINVFKQCLLKGTLRYPKHRFPSPAVYLTHHGLPLRFYDTEITETTVLTPFQAMTPASLPGLSSDIALFSHGARLTHHGLRTVTEMDLPLPPNIAIWNTENLVQRI